MKEKVEKPPSGDSEDSTPENVPKVASGSVEAEQTSESKEKETKLKQSTAPEPKDGRKKTGSKKKVPKQARSDQSKKTKKKSPAEDASNAKITDFFPVRRSSRKTESELKNEKTKEMEKRILAEEEPGLRVVESPVKGRGVLADRPFVRGDFVVEYRGELVEVSDARLREKTYSSSSDVGCYMYYFQFRNKNYCVDATAESVYIGRLVNHSAKKPNLQTRLVDVHSQPRLILVALRDIREGEELLYDYGDRSREAVLANPWLLHS